MENINNKNRSIIMNPAYLKSVVPRDRYVLFLRGNLLVFAGYSIVALETFIAVYLKLTSLTYINTFYISISVLSLTTLLICFTYFKKNLLVWQEYAIFGIYVFSFLIAFSLWVYMLGGLRLLGILNAFTAVTIVLSYTNAVQSLIMSASTLACYYFVTWYAIRIAGQEGELIKETFISLCLIPAFLLISAAAYYINKKRKDLLKVKNELEVLNSYLVEANEKLQNEQAVSCIEMELAGEIQRALFPVKAPRTDDWDLAFTTIPSGAVSGDFYDFYCTGKSLEGLSLFDVSGHGVAPALITILAKPVLYNHFRNLRLSEPGDVLHYSKLELMDELEDVNLYITGILLRMKGSDVDYVNAGHPDLLHFVPSTGEVRIIADNSGIFKGKPIGISSAREKYGSFKLRVSPGEFLVVYSDGLTDARNSKGEQYGITRLSDAVNTAVNDSAESVLNGIMDSFSRFTGDTRNSDDITVIVAFKKPDTSGLQT